MLLGLARRLIVGAMSIATPILAIDDVDVYTVGDMLEHVHV